ncbi:MAG: alpha/beta hydrolase [Desulfobacterales bacterium]|nr:alpha/beta hydrolase [Desulfobacterales bacterium]
MELDLNLIPGRAGMPAVILIHGLGMNRHFWRDAAQCQALGGLGPLTMFLAGPPAEDEQRLFSTGTPDPELTGLGDRLREEGFSLASWSQQDPLGPAGPALKELDQVVHTVAETWPGTEIFLLGHSRGGVLARKYLLEHDNPAIAGLVTICSPHNGTRLAGYADFLRPMGGMLEKILPVEANGSIALAMKRFVDFLKTPATSELQPGSPFLADLARPLPEQLRLLSFGGTDPALLRLFVRAGMDSPWKELDPAELLARAIPAGRLPVELTPRAGDGLVAATSAVLPGASHHNIHRNHVGVAFSPGVQQRIVDFLNRALY